MGTLVESAVLLFTFATAAALASFLLAPGESEAVVRARIRALRQAAERSAAAAAGDPDLSEPLSRRVLAPALARLRDLVLRWTPGGWRAKLDQRLRQAGEPMDAGSFVVLVVLAGLAGAGILGWVLASGNVSGLSPAVRTALWVVGTGAAAGLPSFWLGSAVQRRRTAIQRSLPEALDLLCVAVEAGLSLDGAVQKLSERLPGPLTEELARTLMEMNLGSTREQAWRHLAARVDLPDLRTVTAAIVQAERLGTSLAHVLRIQAGEMRSRRRQRAEERARQVPVKLLFPLVFFIFPAIFVVLLGPAVLYFLKVLGGQG